MSLASALCKPRPNGILALRLLKLQSGRRVCASQAALGSFESHSQDCNPQNLAWHYHPARSTPTDRVPCSKDDRRWSPDSQLDSAKALARHPLQTAHGAASAGRGQAEPHARAIGAGDLELYEDMFALFGVDASQFAALVSQGTKYRGPAGTVLVPGSRQHTKVTLLLRGEALAYEHTPAGAAQESRQPVRKYVGKLQMPASAEGDELQDEASVSVRGSIIGGNALADSQVAEQPYTLDIVSSMEVEWMEWDLQVLSATIDAPGMRAVQASFYHALFVQALRKIDTARVVHKNEKRERGHELAPPPSSKQLLSLFTFVAVPFCGFGFADNAIMILCGDFIDAQFGVAFGLTTMAAAGLGNWVSDAVGLGLGDAIERGAEKLGLSNGGLTKAQENLQVAKITSLMGKLVGISLGCLIGMFPLLFLKPKKTEFAKEDLEIFDEIFRPNGVSTVQFVDLLERGAKRSAAPGGALVQGGQRNGKVLLVLRGEAAAYRHGEIARAEQHPSRARCIYYGRLDRKPLESQAYASAPIHGSVVGGAALGEPDKLAAAYPNDVVAATSVDWIEWDVEDLRQLMEQEKVIQASFYSILFGEMLKSLRSDSGKQKTKHYQSLMAMTVADGVVSDEERQVLEEYMERLHISEQEHLSMLKDLGWTQEAWEQGCKGGKQQAGGPQASSGTATEQLEQAALLIDRALLSLGSAARHRSSD